MGFSANLTYALSILRSLRRRPRKSQALDNHLLHLPVKLITYIAGFLSLPDLILLAQTCYSLRIILWKPMVIAKQSRPEYRLYLLGIAGRRPDKWICQECMMTVHPMIKLDTSEATFSRSSCPHQDRGGISYDTRLLDGQTRLEVRHIQLALKYSKLQKDKFLEHEKALLATHSNLSLRYTTRPGIALTRNGDIKFLHQTILQCHKEHGKISLNDVGDLRICPHVTLCSRRLRCSDHPGYRLQQAICRSLEGPGDEKPHRGACPRCATEFEVQLGTYWLNIYVWQNFGSEGSPGDLAWETRCEPVSLDEAPNLGDVGQTVHHEPGTIREWFAGLLKGYSKI
ncbi:hypothetical protein GGR58DRAFT_499204 [Xylaria digitata]|nr:hypothetical protein GGR58DRAFT_499204 [Xylaria digitata]